MLFFNIFCSKCSFFYSFRFSVFAFTNAWIFICKSLKQNVLERQKKVSQSCDFYFLRFVCLFFSGLFWVFCFSGNSAFFSFRFLRGGWFLLLFCWGGRKFFLSYISRFFKIFRFFCTFFLYICIFFLNLYSKINHEKKLILILFSLNSDLVNLQFFFV